MRALIVDDERHVREGIKLLADWKGNGIGEIYEAANGEDAIFLMKQYRPEIIFSDMKMPKMDGTKLLQWIKDNQPDSKTIVITGYEDYHYMRKAIHFGSSDYLLKPVDPEILNNTLKTVVDEWMTEEADRKKKVSNDQLINKMKPAYRDRKLTRLLNSERMTDEILDDFSLYVASHYTVALLQVSARTIYKFHGDRDLAYFSLLNIINEMLAEKNSGLAFRYLANKGEIVFILWNEWEKTENILKDIYIKIKYSLEISCPIVIGTSVKGYGNLKESYKAAKEVLWNSNVLDNNGMKVIMVNHSVDDKLKNLMFYSSDIKLAIQTNSIEAFNPLMEKIELEYIVDGHLSYKQLIHLEQEYMLISSRWYKNYNISFQIKDSIENRIDLFFDDNGVFDLAAYKSRKKREITIFLKKVQRIAAKKNVNIILDIEKYIVANFNRDVKLQEIADHFYISREYVSRKFKQEFNVNISDFIVQIRMEKAKSLLVNRMLKIYDIANMVGYQDDKYFRKVFKKLVGITPNKYREQEHVSNSDSRK